MWRSTSHQVYQTSIALPERPLLVHHVARICGLASRTVRWNASQGFLRGFKDLRTPKIWRFWRHDVLVFLEQRRLGCLRRNE